MMSRYNSKRYNENLPDCYIYLYHTDECFIIPQYPDTVQDHLDSNFGSQNALSRTAPVFSPLQWSETAGTPQPAPARS